MLFPDAQRTVERFLAPLPLDEFLDRTLLAGFRKVDADAGASRSTLLGPDPYAVLANAAHLAPKLTFHSANASAPPPSLEGVADARDFRARIEQFHERRYSVRFPELRPLSPALERLARAFEVLFHQPVTASAFWSRSGMRAPVHFDDHDLIVVQLRGSKRWHVSRRPSELVNPWRGIPTGEPDAAPFEALDMRPGDLLYLPRGTYHTVDSDAESVHVALGFTPLTVREALIAAVDHLSDYDAALRRTLGSRLAFQLQGAGLERLDAPLTEAAARLLAACRAPGFIAEALQRRSARAVGQLGALPVSAAAPIDLDTVLVQVDTAFCHLTANAEKIDFSFPGGHVYIHAGAVESLLYMTQTPRFRVRDIAGTVTDEVRLSLAAKLLEVGFLEVVPTTTPAAGH